MMAVAATDLAGSAVAEPLTVEDAHARAVARLDGAIETPRLDAGLLLAHVLGVSRAALLVHPERPLTPREWDRLDILLERREAGQPLAWLTGRREFWSLDFEVSAATLVPRPETERLVEIALELACSMTDVEDAVRIADLGTGSGAIAIALAHELPHARIVATDIDEAALAVARRNMERLAPGRIEFQPGDWCAPLESSAYSILVSNPPYLRADDPHLRGDGVRFEPRHALIGGGPDGLDAIRRIGREAPRGLLPDGWLVLEHGADQGEAVRQLLGAQGWREVRTHLDLAGRERVTCARKPR